MVIQMPFEFGSVDTRLKERVTIRLDKQIYNKLRSEKRAFSEIIRDAIKEYIDTEKKVDLENMMTKRKPDTSKWVGMAVKIVLTNGKLIRGTIERVDEAQLFLKEDGTTKKLCLDKEDVEKIEEDDEV